MYLVDFGTVWLQNVLVLFRLHKLVALKEILLSSHRTYSIHGICFIPLIYVAPFRTFHVEGIKRKRL